MRFIIIGLAALAATSAASAQVYVHGYTKKDGTYVAPHYRSSPDANPYNNYSTIGNVNPYTGQAGTNNPYSNGTTGSYGSYSSPYSSSSQSGAAKPASCTYYSPC